MLRKIFGVLVVLAIAAYFILPNFGYLIGSKVNEANRGLGKMIPDADVVEGAKRDIGQAEESTTRDNQSVFKVGASRDEALAELENNKKELKRSVAKLAECNNLLAKIQDGQEVVFAGAKHNKPNLLRQNKFFLTNIARLETVIATQEKTLEVHSSAYERGNEAIDRQVESINNARAKVKTRESELKAYRAMEQSQKLEKEVSGRVNQNVVLGENYRVLGNRVLEAKANVAINEKLAGSNPSSLDKTPQEISEETNAVLSKYGYSTPNQLNKQAEKSAK